jgi:hypothetical protein
MRKELYRAIISAAVLALSSHAANTQLPEDLQRFQTEEGRQLDALFNEAAQDICTSVPIEGSGANISLTEDAKAKLARFTSKLVDRGANDVARLQSEPYRSVVQKNIAFYLQPVTHGKDCKQTTFNALNATLRPMPAILIAAAKSSISSTFVLFDKLDVSIVFPPPGNPTVLINGKAVIVEGKDANARLAMQTATTTSVGYGVSGSTAALNLQVGLNKIVVKYGATELPAYEFKFSDLNRQQFDKADEAYRQAHR